LLLQDAVRELLPGQVEAQPELLDQLGTMVHPRSLKQAGVAVFATLQVRKSGRISTTTHHSTISATIYCLTESGSGTSAASRHFLHNNGNQSCCCCCCRSLASL
jgi:hypothetical protein